MNSTTKAFGISLAFHTLMALLAITVLTMMHRTDNTFAMPLKHMTLVSLSHLPQTDSVSIKHPSPPAKAEPKTVAETPTKPVQKPIPMKAPVIPETIATSAPLPAQTSVPATPVAEVRQSAAANAIAPSAQSAPSPHPKTPSKADINAEKQTFFAYLRSTIQQHLRYPSAARRRGMEGEVNVRFVLENSGVIRDINVRRGESIFHDAAKLAVASASGVKIPAALADTLPSEIELILEFHLN